MTGRRRGFALLSALWLMVMLSAVGLHLALQARNGRLAVSNRIEAMRAQAAANAGVEHLRSRLVARLTPGGSAGLPSGLGWSRTEAILADTVRLDGVSYAVRIDDANSRLHLNRASAEELASLMIALRIDAGRADRVSQAIADWRDADDLRHPRGAETPEYERAGMRRLPRNGPFEILGVDEELFEQLRPYVTTAGSGFVNPNSAPHPVLMSLPGVTLEVAAAIVRLRIDGIALTSAEQFFAALPSGLRNGPLARAGELRARLRFDTQEIEFESEGWLDRTPARARVRGTFVRAGTALILSERRAS
jgi:general secretion pathway protein K